MFFQIQGAPHFSIPFDDRKRLNLLGDGVQKAHNLVDWLKSTPKVSKLPHILAKTQNLSKFMNRSVLNTLRKIYAKNKVNWTIFLKNVTFPGEFCVPKKEKC